MKIIGPIQWSTESKLQTFKRPNDSESSSAHYHISKAFHGSASLDVADPFPLYSLSLAQNWQVWILTASQQSCCCSWTDTWLTVLLLTQPCRTPCWLFGIWVQSYNSIGFLFGPFFPSQVAFRGWVRRCIYLVISFNVGIFIPSSRPQDFLATIHKIRWKLQIMLNR